MSQQMDYSSLQAQLLKLQEEFEIQQSKALEMEEFLNYEITEKNSEIEKLQAELTQAKKSHSNGDQTQLINDMSDELKQLKVTIQELETERDYYKEEAEAKGGVDSNSSELIQQKEYQIMSLKNHLQEEAEAKSLLEAEVDNLKFEMRQILSDQSSKENTDFEEKNQEICALQEIQVQQENKIKLLQSELQNLKLTSQGENQQKIAKLENQLLLTKDISTQMEQLRKKNEELQSELDNFVNLQEAYEESESQKTLLNQKFTECQEELKQVLAENEALKQQLSRQPDENSEIDELKQNPKKTQIIYRRVGRLNDIVEKFLLQDLGREQVLYFIIQVGFNRQTNSYLHYISNQDRLLLKHSKYIQNKRNELITYQNEIEQAREHEENIRNLQKQINAFSQRTSQMEKENADLFEMNNSEKKKNKQLQDQLEELNLKYNYLVQQNENFEQKTIQQSEEILSLKQKSETLELKNHQQTTVQDDYQKLIALNNQLQQEVNQLKQESMLIRIQNQREGLQQIDEFKKAKAQLQEWETLIQLTSGNISSLNSKDVQVQKLSKIKEYLVNYFFDVQNQNSQIQAQNQILQNNAYQYEQELSELKSTVQNLEEQLSSHQLQQDELQKKTVRLSIYNNQLENHENLRTQLDTLQSKYDSLQLIKQSQNELGKKVEKDQIQQLEQENSYLKEQLMQFRSAQETIKQDTSEKQSCESLGQGDQVSIDELRKQIDAQNEQIQQYQNKIQELEELIYPQQQYLQIDELARQDELEAIEEESHSPLVRQFDESEYIETTQLKEQNEILCKQIHELKQQNVHLINQTQLLKRNLEDCQNVKAQNRQLLNDLQFLKSSLSATKADTLIQQYSPLNIQKVTSFLKQKECKKKEIDKLQKQEEVLINESNVIQKKNTKNIQRNISELNQKLSKLQDTSDQVMILLKNLILDIKQKLNQLTQECLTKKAQVLSYLNKLKQQAEIILNKMQLVNTHREYKKPQQEQLQENADFI